MSNNTTFQEKDFRDWLRKNYGVQDYEGYRGTQTEEIAIQYAQSKWSEACEAQKVICAQKAETQNCYLPRTDEVQTSINHSSILRAPNAPYPNDKP